MTAQVRYQTVDVSHEGCVRSLNEDAHLVRDDVGLWVVADGMGGHDRGEVASGSIVSALQDVGLNGDFEANLPHIEAALGGVNSALCDMSDASGERLGSTVAALHIQGLQFACLWAGDSRIYRLREGVLRQLTRDHTQVQDLVDHGALTAEEAKGHPMSHVVSRCIGIDRTFEPETITGALEVSDIFLLCSDGLSGMVSDEEIEASLNAGSRVAASNLLDLAIARGAPDNVTVVTVACEEMTALVLPQEA
jgi:serine/threonine-protein phosphatase Stp1